MEAKHPQAESRTWHSTAGNGEEPSWWSTGRVWDRGRERELERKMVLPGGEDQSRAPWGQ